MVRNPRKAGCQAAEERAFPPVGRWGPGDACAALAEAVETLRLMPAGARDRPAAPRCAWPDWVKRMWHDTPASLRIARPAPSAAAIDRADAVLTALYRLPAHLMQVAVARSMPKPARPKWREIAAHFRITERTGRNWLREAWCRLADEVNRGA